MGKERDRAIRRHHSARLAKARAGYSGMQVNPPDMKLLGMVVATATRCSCVMCGNPRRHWREKTAGEISDLEFNRACLNEKNER